MVEQGATGTKSHAPQVAQVMVRAEVAEKAGIEGGSMDHKKWLMYLRIPEEHPASSEQPDNMQYYGKHVLDYGRVLDVGCGTGMLVNWLDKQKVNAMGCSVVQSEIDKGKARYGSHLRLDYADMHELPYTDGTIDAIHCKDVLEHSIAPYIALCEFNRVLRMDGYLLIVQPGEEWIECDYHYSIMTDRQMKEMMRKCGFEIERIEKGPPPKGNTIFTEFHCKKIGDISWPK